MRYKLHAFFSGRNGFDFLGKTVLYSAVITLLVIPYIGIDWLHSVLLLCALVCIGWAVGRASSRNIEKCQSQNSRFETWINFHKQRFLQRKTSSIYRCPKCKQVLRVPKAQGKICITCRSCGEKFIKKT